MRRAEPFPQSKRLAKFNDHKAYEAGDFSNCHVTSRWSRNQGIMWFKGLKVGASHDKSTPCLVCYFGVCGSSAIGDIVHCYVT